MSYYRASSSLGNPLSRLIESSTYICVARILELHSYVYETCVACVESCMSAALQQNDAQLNIRS